MPRRRYPKNNLQLPLDFTFTASSPKKHSKFNNLLSPYFSKKGFWWLFNFIILGLLYNMLPPQIIVVLVFGNIIWGIIVFAPAKRLLQLFWGDISKIPNHNINIFNGLIVMYVVFALINFWLPAIRYLEYQQLPRDIKNLVIQSVATKDLNGEPGMLLEFGTKWDDIDPVNITVTITGASVNQSLIWWYKPNLIKNISNFNINKATLFQQGIAAEALLARANANPPDFSLATLGKPITPNDSLYIYFLGRDLTIEGIAYHGVHYHREDNHLIMNKR